MAAENASARRGVSRGGWSAKRVAPYMAVGLSTIVHGIGSRKDIDRNLRIVEGGIHAPVPIIGIGMIVHRGAKDHVWCRERSCTPHDVYDRWVELLGGGIDAFHGAEVVYRPSEAVPMTKAGTRAGGNVATAEPRSRALHQRLHAMSETWGPYTPTNLWLRDEPVQHAEVDEVYRGNIQRRVKRGSFTPPAVPSPRARFLPPNDEPAEGDWESLHGLWDQELRS